jgi:transcriptional regulator with GAF, ATPase, and Fis domain
MDSSVRVRPEIPLSPAREFLAELAQCRRVSEIFDALDLFMRDRTHSVCICLWLLDGDAKQGGLALYRVCGAPAVPPAQWRHASGTFDRLPLDEPLVGQVAGLGTCHIGGVSSGWTPPDWARELGIVAYAAQPVINHGEILGVLCNFLRQEVALAQTDEAAFIVRVLALQIGSTHANERAMDDLEQLRRKLELENDYLREEVLDVQGYKEFLGTSAQAKACLEKVRLVADTSTPVLILGETGTGKELIAHAVHEQSARRRHPLIKVNCPSVPASLWESEFFGHVRGAFTSAAQDRLGRFQLADKGTLFLDEISEVPLELQGKLLRVLQTGTFERVGDDRSRVVDVRIIAASNRDLLAEADAGRFRADLYYRLNVFPIALPPLRERLEDVEVLASHFFAQACQRIGLQGARLTPAQLERLRQYHWPGNVRELRNVMDRFAILSRRGPPSLDDLVRLSKDARASSPPPLPALTPSAGAVHEKDWQGLERQRFHQAIEQAGGRVQGPGGAAELLGMSPTAVRRRLKTLGLR